MPTQNIISGPAQPLSFEDFREEVKKDFFTACLSREASLLGRREVLTGKAKFGIFGDGKEVPQLAMAKVFRNGDFRSGYYRDQTFMFAIGKLTIEQWFAGLYAHPSLDADPMSAGRQMGGHFATHSLDENGEWLDLTKQKNSSADISPTAGQMPRLLGLAQASKVFRALGKDDSFAGFTDGGNEVAFGSIGDASTSEGLFWETMNAAAVLQVPMVMCVWDDGHGISVPKKYQTARESISDALWGMRRDEQKPHGLEIFRVKGWDYPALCETFHKAADLARTAHVPVLIHVEELTQPQGHSTSGSHERYKSPERLQWEAENDCIRKMKEWMIGAAIATEEECRVMEEKAKQDVRDAKNKAWSAFLQPIQEEKERLMFLLSEMPGNEDLMASLQANREPIRRELAGLARKALRRQAHLHHPGMHALQQFAETYLTENAMRYGSHLYSQSVHSPLHCTAIAPRYDQEKPVDGREVLRDNFDALFSRIPGMLIFGEDVGGIGDVNQGCEGLQKKFGETRVSDTGIREATIIGQGIGMAMRGLRPVAEIQYLDYLLYALQILSDDLCTLHYRTAGRQKAPLIVRTRGHRLEGIWHSGSPMGVILGALRGMYICVPRNMTKAAGFYNNLLQGDAPALVIECLNGYRLKEKLPSNLGEFKEPLGITEVIREGVHITLVTYGSCCRIAMEAADMLSENGIEVEVIDIQTLIPFDLEQGIRASLKKTSRLVILDEDVPGGASAYILREILETQKAWHLLDAAPVCMTAKEHRPAYGSDGDYFSKPSADDVYDVLYGMMNENNPGLFPAS
ncbi:MAG: thiamine pyrophosphate-dependent enzyme [Bacteroidota bacterium]